MQHNTGSL